MKRVWAQEPGPPVIVSSMEIITCTMLISSPSLARSYYIRPSSTWHTQKTQLNKYAGTKRELGCDARQRARCRLCRVGEVRGQHSSCETSSGDICA
eukprot:6185396-Pleurochrysis_carterae.AAC.2